MPNNLPHRVEEAGAEDQRALLEEAFELIFPRPHSLMMRVQEPDATDEELKALSTAIVAWRNTRNNFLAMLDASAWESAAMMLKPDGSRIEFIEMEDGRGAARVLWPGEARLPDLEPLYSTLALALLAAILKAKEAGDAD